MLFGPLLAPRSGEGGAAVGRTRLVIVDDHELVRDGLRSLIGREPGLELVGEAATFAEGMRLVTTLRPDLVVLDLKLPDGSGLEGCREMVDASPGTQVLILTAFSSPAARVQAREAGARGMISKRADGSHLIEAIRRVVGGDEVFETSTDVGTPHRRQPLDHLTDREREVLGLIARGWTNREIARNLTLAEKTIKNYVSMVLAKLGVENRAAAAALYVREVEAAEPGSMANMLETD